MVCELASGGGQLSLGDYAIAPAGAAHQYRGITEDSEVLVLDIHGQDPLLQALSNMESCSVEDLLCAETRFARLPDTLRPMLQSAAEQLKDAPPVRQRRLSAGYLPMMLMALLEARSQNQTSLRLLTKRELDLEKLHHLVDQRLDLSFSNALLADLFHLSESHFYAVFQHQTGLTPQKYLLKRRLMYAHRRLTGSRLPVSVIAHDHGFASTSAFSRAYKKHYGMSPAQARFQLFGQ